MVVICDPRAEVLWGQMSSLKQDIIEQQTQNSCVAEVLYQI